MKFIMTLLISTIGMSAFALDYKTVDVVHVYGSGWNADGGWLLPMTEAAADGLIKLEDAKIKRAKCSVKGVLRSATFDPNTLEFLAYDIKCQ